MTGEYSAAALRNAQGPMARARRTLCCMTINTTTLHRLPFDPAGRVLPIASTREGALFRDGGTNLIREGRLRAMFLGAQAVLAQELAMKSTPNDMPERTSRKRKPEKPSRAAEYIAVLYVALVLLTPWLVRDASLLAPPSKGVEMQMSYKAAAIVPAVSKTLVAPAGTPER